MSITINYQTPECAVCGQSTTLVLDRRGFESWVAGTYVQNAFPELSADERELLISGTHAPCWDVLMSPGEDEREEVGDECAGCLTGADLGFPEYAHAIAHAHPDCPVHGEVSG